MDRQLWKPPPITPRMNNSVFNNLLFSTDGSCSEKKVKNEEDDKTAETELSWMSC